MLLQHLLHHRYCGEVLPYLEVQKEEESVNIVEMPNITGMTLKEAKEVLKELGLEYSVQGEENVDSIITKQVPNQGIQINEGTKVIVYF